MNPLSRHILRRRLALPIPSIAGIIGVRGSGLKRFVTP